MDYMQFNYNYLARVFGMWNVAFWLEGKLGKFGKLGK